MAKFTQSDILSELAKVFRGKADPQRESVALSDPATTHAQVLEIASLTLLSDPNAFYYISLLLRNRVTSRLTQEIDIVEDMLVALKNIEDSRRDTPNLKDGTADLVDAQTALLGLDVVGTVVNRPELVNFQNAIDRFTARIRPNVVSATNTLVIPKSESRSQIRTNMAQLLESHDELLKEIDRIVNLLTNYELLDLPTTVSRHALLNSRTELAALQADVELASSDDAIARSRSYLLTSLTTKSAVGILQDFTLPRPGQHKVASVGTGTAFKGIVGTPKKSIGQGGPWYGTAFGTGTAALVDSVVGPFALSIAATDLKVKIDKGSEQTVSFASLSGPSIHGNNAPPYTSSQLVPTWPGPQPAVDEPPEVKTNFLPADDLYVNVDPNIYDFESIKWTAGMAAASAETTVEMQPPIKLGFKHLGTPFVVTSLDHDVEAEAWTISGNTKNADPDSWNDALETSRWTHIHRPRCITELELLGSTSFTAVSAGSVYTFTGVILAHHVGFYVKNGTDRYEITKVAGNLVTLDMRGDADLALGAYNVYGTKGDATRLTFKPAILAHVNDGIVAPPGVAVVSKNTAKVGPAIKAARVASALGGTIALVVTELGKDTQPADAWTSGTNITNQPHSSASHHVVFKAKFDGSNQLTMQPRSAMNPKLLLSDEFLNVRDDLQVGSGAAGDFVQFPGPYPMETRCRSIHEVIGVQPFREPDLDTYISEQEIVKIIDDGLTGASASIVETEIVASTLTVNGATKTATDSGNNFTTLGVVLGYRLELLAGDNRGIYVISSAAASVLTLELPKNFVGTEVAVPYRIYSLKIRITSSNAGVGSTVEVTQTPAELGFSTDLQTGTVPAIKMTSKFGEDLDVSNLLPGDVSGSYVVSTIAADGASINLVTAVASTLEAVDLIFVGKVEEALVTLVATMGTIIRNNVQTLTLDLLDRSLIPVLTPGATFSSNLNEARRHLAEILSVLTQAPRRSAEHQATIPVTDDLESTLAAYAAPVSTNVDNLVRGLQDHKYDRAAELLSSGQFAELFETTHETASFAGAVMKAMQTVVTDLPREPVGQGAVEEGLTDVQIHPDPDADFDFSDTEDEELVPNG